MQFSQGVKFYQSVNDLPDNETLVSYFMKLDHMDPTLAAQTLGNHVGLSIYGRMTPVSTPPGLLITESAAMVRQLISIKEVIDSADTANALITKFIPLKYADAATVAQIVQATLDAQAHGQGTKRPHHDSRQRPDLIQEFLLRRPATRWSPAATTPDALALRRRSRLVGTEKTGGQVTSRRRSAPEPVACRLRTARLPLHREPHRRIRPARGCARLPTSGD